MFSRKFLYIIAFVLLLGAALVARDKWVQGSNGRINGYTIIGGSEPGRSRLYLCAGYMRGTYHPGKIVGRNCNFGYGGKEITRSNYYTLQVSRSSLRRYRWMSASYGNVPTRRGYVPIPVGREGSRTLYVCRANYRGGKHPGKLVGRNCNFGYGGKEITIPRYQILMFNTAN